MAAKNNCIKRDVCIFAKESFCKSNSECGHYIMEKGFTSTNNRSDEIAWLESFLVRARDVFAGVSDFHWLEVTINERIAQLRAVR